MWSFIYDVCEKLQIPAPSSPSSIQNNLILVLSQSIEELVIIEVQ